MFLLYIDGSGAVSNPEERHFILAGVAVFERNIHYLIRDLDSIVKSFGFDPEDQVEIHGSPMYTGKKRWRRFPSQERVQMIQNTLNVLLKASRNVRAFGIAVDKKAISPKDPVEEAFEEISNRFNLFLSRNYHTRGEREEDRNKGLIVMDKSSYEQPLQRLARDFRVSGTRWGALKNLAEVPLFVDSQASRIVQLADLIAYAMWRKYEHQDGRFFDPIIPRFDQDGGVIHGLVHKKPPWQTCYCPACATRAAHK